MSSVHERPDWWRPVWLCLAGEQPLPNILPVMAYRPEKVIFLHTDFQPSEQAARRCARFLKTKFGIETSSKRTDAFDTKIVTEDVMRLLMAHGLGNVLLNWTGGTKPMSLAALQALPDLVPTLYFDSRRGVLINLSPPYRELPPTEPLSLEDMIPLNANAYLVENKGAPPLCPHCDQILCNLSNNKIKTFLDYCKTHINKLHLDKKEQRKEKRRWKKIEEEGIQVPFADDETLSKKLIAAMENDRLLLRGNAFRPNNNGLDYLYGFWFEKYVKDKVEAGLAKLMNDPPQVYANIKVRWAGSRADNEVDLAFLYRNRLYLISCTTASLGDAEKRRGQVENFANRFGGSFACAMLACTLFDYNLNELRSRKSSSMAIPFFDEWKKPDDVLRKWFEM